MAPLALPGYAYEWISCSPLEVAANNLTASQKFKGMLQHTKDELQFRKSSCTRHHNHTRIIMCTFSAAEVISFGTSMGIALAAAGGSNENLQVVKMPKAMSSEHLGAYLILGTTRFSVLRKSLFVGLNFAAFSYIQSSYVSSTIDVARTVFTTKFA